MGLTFYTNNRFALNLTTKPAYPWIVDTLISLAQSCKTLKHLKEIQTQIITQSQLPNQCSSTFHFLLRCFELKQISRARQVFDQIPDPNGAFYNLIFKGYLKNELYKEVIMLFRDMLRSKVRPDCFSFSMVLKSCGKVMAIKESEGVHCLVMKIGLKSNSYVGTTLIDLYSWSGQVTCAYQVFSEMVLRSVVAWTAMINGYVKNGDLVSARSLFDMAPERDVVVWNTMVSCYIEKREMEEARKIFDLMPNKDLMSWNTLLNGYTSNGDLEGCKRFFEEMPERNTFSWNGLIVAYTRNGCYPEVLDTFKRMLNESNVQPDHVTLVHMLSACAKLGALHMGRWVHVFAEGNGLKGNIYVGNGLIDMYAKCGMIESAVDVFCKMGSKDLISWNTLINGLAVHGHGADALSLFDEMINSGQKPDRVTFVGLLCACSHLGLVQDGFTYFNMMQQEFSIVPQIEHYGCMVDLLARAGNLEQAVDFVRKMPLKADTVIWTALLGACRIYKNIEFAELALRKLIELEPQNPANFVMLANIHGDAQNFANMAKLKVAMRDTRSRKLPGCSLIEVDDEVVEFYCYDERHSDADKIYVVLRELTKLLKSCGYIPGSMDLEQEI